MTLLRHPLYTSFSIYQSLFSVKFQDQQTTFTLYTIRYPSRDCPWPYPIFLILSHILIAKFPITDSIATAKFADDISFFNAHAIPMLLVSTYPRISSILMSTVESQDKTKRRPPILSYHQSPVRLNDVKFSHMTRSDSFDFT